MLHIFFTGERTSDEDNPMFKLMSLTVDISANYEVGPLKEIYLIR